MTDYAEKNLKRRQNWQRMAFDATVKEKGIKKEMKPTNKYKFCNHHHELNSNQEIVDFGSGKFVADKLAIPLLKALNEIGLKTRTHHFDKNQGFVGIMLDNVQIEVRKVFENSARRTKYNNKYCLILSWQKEEK